jgi:hypothetical protein
MTTGSMLAESESSLSRPSPQRAPFPLLLSSGTSLTSLEIPAIQGLRLQMFVDPSEGRIRPDLAQFLPDKRELWVDCLNRADRRFRLRFMRTTDGDKLEFLDLKERPLSAPSTLAARPSLYSFLTNRYLRLATRSNSSFSTTVLKS